MGYNYGGTHGSWQDGVQETNCPILPDQNWTNSFRVKIKLEAFSISLHYSSRKPPVDMAIRIYNRESTPVPFSNSNQEFDILIGD